MDHSYSTEREKVQKTDHSYFTVAKKTPKVVLRKAQQMKEHQVLSRTSVGQDHSYVRPEHVLRLTELAAEDTACDGKAADVLSACIPRLPDTRALFGPIDNGRLCDVLRSSEADLLSRVRSLADHSSITCCDLDSIDAQISGIRLDHAYDLKKDSCAHRRSVAASVRSKMADPCRDQLLSLRLHDHTYLGTKIVHKA